MALCLDNSFYEEDLRFSDSFLSPSFFLFYSRKEVLGRGGNSPKMRQEKSFSGFLLGLGALHGHREGGGQENQQERLRSSHAGHAAAPAPTRTKCSHATKEASARATPASCPDYDNWAETHELK